MAKKTKEEIKTTPMQQSILALDGKKHVKAYLLSQTGLKNGEIALLLDTNQGAIGNALKDYNTNPEKVEKAKAFLAP